MGNGAIATSRLRLTAEFEHIQRRYDARIKAVVATLHPGDYYVSTNAELIGTVLGSCVSACMRDPRQRIGGMNHFMLPGDRREGSGAWAGADLATRFGSVAMERLVNALLDLGAHRAELEVKLVGGGRVLDALTDIGRRNIQFVREYVRSEGFRVIGEDLGDVYPRKVLYDPVTGSARVKRLARSDQGVVLEEERYLRDLERLPESGEIELF
jgi:chemotaxis protein CheD